MFFFYVFGGSLEGHISITMFGYASDIDGAYVYFEKNKEWEQHNIGSFLYSSLLI